MGSACESLIACPPVRVCSRGVGFLVGVCDKNVVSLKADSAEGGWDSLVTALDDTEVSFGAFAAVVDGATRFVFFTYCGPAVSAVRRGRVSLQKNAVYNAFDGVVCEVYAVDREELAHDAVAAVIAKALGKSAVVI